MHRREARPTPWLLAPCSVCVRVCMRTCVHVCRCTFVGDMHAHVSQRVTFLLFSRHYLLCLGMYLFVYFWFGLIWFGLVRQCLSLAWNLLNTLFGCPASPEICLSLPPSVRILSSCHSTQIFISIQFWSSNSGTHPGKAHILLTDASPRPP